MFSDLSIEETNMALNKVVVSKLASIVNYVLDIQSPCSLLVSTPTPPPPMQRLVMSLHILLQYFCAYVQLGGHTHGEMGGAWGGKEGIGIVIIEICSIEISYFKKSINCWRI